jgi:pimeloyl-ACP methyl ester carboxylesterase
MELNGITLAYNVYEKQNAPVVVLIHGLASTKESYTRTIPFLTDKYHVLSLDLRGHGESSQVGPYTFEQLVEDIRAVLDQEGVEKATLVGGSFASVPVQQFAVKYPERVDKLVLLDGGFSRLVDMPGFDLQAMHEREPFSAATMEEMQAGVRQSYGEHVTDFIDEQTLRETVQKEDGRVYLRLPHEAYLSYLTEYATFDLDDLGAKLKTPVLVLQATMRNPYYETAIGTYLEKFPTAQAVTIPNSPHPLMVSHPQEVADYIDRFVQGQI